MRILAVALLGTLLLISVLAYLRWRRRRLWWIHCQLRSAFVRSALFPLLLSSLMGLVLVLLLLAILTLATLRLYPEEWLRTALPAGETCSVQGADVVCGPCRLSQDGPPDVYWTRPGRWWVLPEAFRRWWDRCPGRPLPSGALLIAVETDAGRLRWGPLRQTELAASTERLGIPLREVWFLRAHLSVTGIGRRSTPSGWPWEGITWERHRVYAAVPTPNRPFVWIEAPYFFWPVSPGGPDPKTVRSPDRPVTLTGIDLRVAALDWVWSALHTPDVPTNLLIRVLLIAFLVLLAATGLVTTGFLASGYWTAYRIGRAVSQIEDAMRQVAVGRFPVRVPLRRDDQLGHLAHQVEQTSQALAFLMEEKLSKDRLDREVEIARAVQQRLFPAAVPTWPDLDIAIHLTPARRLSGDYYDFFQTESGLRGGVVADVVGKGLPAGLLMASVHALLHFAHRSVRIPEDLVRMFRSLHRHLLDHTEPHQYVTLFYAAFPEGTDTLGYLGAGHPPALYWHGGTLTWLDSTGPVLGAWPEADWTVRTVRWLPSATLVLYTDGLLEAADPTGQEYGRERLARSVLRMTPGALTAQTILEGILEDLRAWRGTTEVEDDVLLMVVRRI